MSGRSAGCLGLPLSARGSTSPGRTLPHGARGCLQDCGEMAPALAPALALWGHPGSGSADAGIPPLGQDTTSIMATAVRSRWPRIPRAAPEGAWLLDSVWRGSLGRMLPRGSPVRFRAGSASSQEHCRSARSGAVGVREQKPTTPATRQGRSRTAAEYTASLSTADDCFKLPPIADLPSGPSDLTARSPHRGKRRCSGQGRPRP